MISWRKTLLALFALILSGGSLMAASREERAYTAAVAAFHDGIYDRAQTELAQFIKDYQDSRHLAEAILLKGEAEYKLGRFTEAIGTLSAPAGDWNKLADQYAYWRGEAQFGRGDFDHAAATFTNLAADFPDSPLRLNAVVGAAAAYERLADWPQLTNLLEATNGVFARAAARDSANELVSRGRLLLAQAQFAQQEFDAARATLNQIDPQVLTPDLNWQRANLACQVNLGGGDLVAALAGATNLVEIARQQKDTAPARLAESLALHAAILERLKRWPEAAVVWSQIITNGATPVDWQRQSMLKLADNAMAQGNFTNAMLSLTDFLQRFTNSPAAGLARLTLGELNLREFVVTPSETNYLATALATFDRLLATNAEPGDLAGKAHLDRGWCYWLAGKTNESAADFSAASEQLSLSEDLAVARFKLGDALFALQDYLGARACYQAVLTQFAGWPRVMESLGDRALYQIVRTSVNLQDRAGAEHAMQVLLDRFPKSNLQDNAELLLGEGIFDFGSATNAAGVFSDFVARFPDSPLRPQAELDRARTYERAQDWPAAIAGYESWLDHFPTNDLRPQVEYALGQAEYAAGNETNALACFAGLVAQFPADPLAPLAQWWMADYYFRQGGTNYSEAEKNYEDIFQNTNAVWRNSKLFYPAQLMAARAAMGRQDFQGAVNFYLTRLLSDTNCPEALRTQALFAYGGVLMRMESPDTNRPFANFELATNVFSQLCQDNPTNQLGPLACSELGDCNLQLGALDAATNAYWQVMHSPYAGPGLRSRAQVGLGRVLEKMAELSPPDERKPLLRQARDCYLNVVDTGYGKGLTDHESADAFWVKVAGLRALPLLSAGDSYPTNFFSTLETLLPPLKATLEKKRAALKAGATPPQ